MSATKPSPSQRCVSFRPLNIALFICLLFILLVCVACNLRRWCFCVYVIPRLHDDVD